MATQRLVNTNFWKDTYVIDLDPIQKLLFLYFLTNPRTSLAGVYEISIREIAFDTGIDKDMVEKILNKFCMDGKMYYEKGWLVVHNFVKHQRLNPSIKIGIERSISELPKWLQDKISLENDENKQISLLASDNSVDNYSLPTDSPHSATTKPNLTKLKETKPNENKTPSASSFFNKDQELAAKEISARKRKPRPTKQAQSIDEIFSKQSYGNR